MATPQRVIVRTASGTIVMGTATGTAGKGKTVDVTVGTGSRSRTVRGEVVEVVPDAPAAPSALPRPARPARQTAPRSYAGGSLVGAAGPLHATSILPESKDVRLLDTAVTAGVAAGSVVFTATRKTVGAQYAWGGFWLGLGAVMAIGGRGEVRYGGFGLVGAQSAYLLLRTVMPDLSKATTAQYVAPAGVVRLGYAVLRSP